MAPNDAPNVPATDADEADVLRLDDALKLAGVAGTGGQAKQLIQQGDVRVNGEIETRRKRKLVEGDVVEVGGESFEIALSDDDAEDPDDREHEDADAGAAPGVAAAFVDADGDEDDRDGGFDDDPDGDALALTPAELERWADWVVDRMREDDGEAVILRLGSLHPDALEALFELLPADVEDAVLDALDAVLEEGEEGGFGPAGPGRDGPLEA
jgi:ribosome-associated protein